jgi:integrase
LRRGGFATQDAAEAELALARELLAISTYDDDKAAIADAIQRSIKTTQRLPDADTIRRKIRTGQELATTVTTGQWLQEWLAGNKKLRNSTRRSYEAQLRMYFLPHIGYIPLDRLRVTHVAAIFEAIDDFNELIDKARTSCNPKLRAKVKGRQRVGPATKQRIRATLRAALNQAIRHRLIDLNVASLIELPSGKRPKALVWTAERIAQWRNDYQRHMNEMCRRKRLLSELEDPRYGSRFNRLNAYVAAPRPSPVMVWTPEQTYHFLQRARAHPWYVLYHLIAFRGLRRGEACGLRWADLDLENAIATIRWQIVQHGYDSYQDRPKSEAGDRQIYLDTQTVAELKTHRVRQHKDRLACGSTWTDSGFVFTQPDGTPLHPAHVSHQFKQIAMEADLPPVRLHDLRHGAATILLAAGHDIKIVQETLGLSSITIAADTYTSVLPHLARQSAEDAANIIWNAGKPASTVGPSA